MQAIPIAVGEPLEESSRSVRFYRDCEFRFIDRQQAAEFLAVEDAFLAGLSRFDLQSRLQTTNEATTADYLAMTREQVLDWDAAEIDRLARIAAEIKPKLERFDLPFPDEIVLIKYSGQGEAGAAYTRRHGIVFPRHKLAADAVAQTHLVLHELFHVLSRQDSRLRRDLYEVIGFQPCNPIRLPTDLVELKISNPDAPTIDYYISLDEQDTDGNRVVNAAVPVLLAREEYHPDRGRTFFDYLEFKLLHIEKFDGVWLPKRIEQSGEISPVVVDGFTSESYRRQIGRNTNYIIHPDEILADNFAFLVAGREGLPSPEILDAMNRLLQSEDVP
ncbi:MAG: hypothetical protein WEA31_10775 [Pirellulales bacterium]